MPEDEQRAITRRAREFQQRYLTQHAKVRARDRRHATRKRACGAPAGGCFHVLPLFAGAVPEAGAAPVRGAVPRRRGRHGGVCARAGRGAPDRPQVPAGGAGQRSGVIDGAWRCRAVLLYIHCMRSPRSQDRSMPRARPCREPPRSSQAADQQAKYSKRSTHTPTHTRTAPSSAPRHPQIIEMQATLSSSATSRSAVSRVNRTSTVAVRAQASWAGEDPRGRSAVVSEFVSRRRSNETQHPRGACRGARVRADRAHHAHQRQCAPFCAPTLARRRAALLCGAQGAGRRQGRHVARDQLDGQRLQGQEALQGAWRASVSSAGAHARGPPC